jgi:hypothetical protein
LCFNAILTAAGVICWRLHADLTAGSAGKQRTPENIGGDENR